MKNAVIWLSENWSILVALLVIAFVKFITLPNSEQTKKIKKCILAWVVAAEKELGAKTGRVKLSVVYGYFVTAFPFIKNFISFDRFSEWVDEALDEMRKMLESNQNLQQVIENSNVIQVVSADTITTEETAE